MRGASAPLEVIVSPREGLLIIFAELYIYLFLGRSNLKSNIQKLYQYKDLLAYTPLFSRRRILTIYNFSFLKI